MKKLLVILTTLLILTISSTSATNWYYIGQGGPNGDIFSAFIDNDNVQKNNDEAIVWVKYDYPDGKQLIEKCYFYRPTRTITQLYTVLYHENGSVIQTYTYEKQYPENTPIVPGTIYDFILELIW